jgi:D-alanine-D-alanine ligase
VDLLPIRIEADQWASLGGYAPARTLVFNLCETLNGRADDHPRVTEVLQALGLRFTGASAHGLARCADKARAKRVLRAHGVPTAPFQVCRTERVAVRVPLPAIVKPVAEDGSIGIGRDAVVTSRDGLRRRVAHVLESYRQPALVEEFIAGREFNVSIWGNGTAYVLPLTEQDFGDWPELTRVVHFPAKWEADAPEYTGWISHCPAEVDEELAARIRAVALQAYRLLGCKDYGRVDMRVKDGVPYVLELNPNPCLAPDAGFATASRAAGYDYAHMLEQIVRWAWERPLPGRRVGALGRARRTRDA